MVNFFRANLQTHAQSPTLLVSTTSNFMGKASKTNQTSFGFRIKEYLKPYARHLQQCLYLYIIYITKCYMSKLLYTYIRLSIETIRCFIWYFILYAVYRYKKCRL